MTRNLVAIDGIDGSGKTSFAARLERECSSHSIEVALLRIDDFRNHVDWDREAADDAALYYDAYYDFDAVERCLLAFTAGAATFEVPTFDSVSEEVTGNRTIQFTELLILEGVFPLRAAPVADGTLVYLATSYPEARRRIIARDMAKNRSREEVEHRIDHRYFPTQRRYHDEYHPRERAQLIIDNENPAQPQLVAAVLDDLPATVRQALRAVSSSNEP